MTNQGEQVFHEVADLSPAARRVYFADHAVGERTRGEVESLIAFDAGSSVALEDDLSRCAGQALAAFEGKGAYCGSYRLGSSLGRGGMGAVYLASRVDGEVSQDVAVKLLRPGMDDPHLRERFLA